MAFKYKLGVIGAGNMAKAIVGGIVRSHLMAVDKIIVSDPIADIGIDGVVNVNNNLTIMTQCEYVLCAVKPQIFAAIKDEFAYCTARAVISIMAGISTKTILSVLPSGTKAVRVMPNTPCMIGYGMSVIADNADDAEATRTAKEIFASIGEVLLMGEDKFDAVTSLSGSGPAYVYSFINAMIDAGVKSGLNYKDSRLMAVATARGAAEMISSSDKAVSELIDAVCSKGGTTIEAINIFRSNDLDGLVDSAMRACRKRSEELGKA